jgi:hypothetical protein
MYVGMPNLNLFLRTTSMVIVPREVINNCGLGTQYLKCGLRVRHFHLLSAAASRIERCLHRGLNHFDFTTAIRVLTAVTLAYAHGHGYPRSRP